MKFNIIIFIMIICPAFLTLSADQIEQIATEMPYDVLDTIPDSIFINMDSTIFFSMSPLSGNFNRLHPVTINGLEYYYELHSNLENPGHNRVVWMIVVQDTSFITPEGLRIGQPFTAALGFSHGQIVRMYDAFKVYVKLPSGWNAAYRHGGLDIGLRNDAGIMDTIPISERKIDYFFKYPFHAGYSKYESEYLDTVQGY